MIAAGFSLGLANAVRHRIRGYTTPRTFKEGDAQRAAEYVTKVVRRWGEVTSFAGKRVLEIGPGPDLGTGALILSRGAKHYTACDLFPLVGDSAPVFTALRTDVDRQNLSYVVTDFPDLTDLAGPFDLAVSNATLEHVADVQTLFLRLRSLGVTEMAHYVDAKTHMRWFRDHDPLNILRFSDSAYRLLRFPGAPNRMLADDYVLVAQRAGFVSRVQTGRRADDHYLEHAKVARAFRDRNDLGILSFMLVCEALESNEVAAPTGAVGKARTLGRAVGEQ